MSAGTTEPVEEGIGAEWTDFLTVFEAALKSYREQRWRSYRSALVPWHSALFNELRSLEVQDEFIRFWTRTFYGPSSRDLRLYRVEPILRAEIRGLTVLLSSLVEVPSERLTPNLLKAREGRRGTIRRLFFRRVGLKEGIGGAGTLFGTLESLLDAFPLLKAAFTIAHEAADVATGGK
jgi:hypothetical protein